MGSNEATDGGVASVAGGGTLTLTRAAVVADSASENGGGVFNSGDVTGSHSVIAANSAKKGASIFDEGGTDTLKDSFVEP